MVLKSGYTYITDENKVLMIGLNPGVDTIEINTLHLDKGASAVFGAIKVPYTTVSNVDVSKIGNYQIVYTAEYEGQKLSIVRYVYVIDETAPIVTLNLGVDTVFVGSEWTDAGATVVDNSLENLTIEVTGTVNINVVGTYIITYKATDSSGNTSTQLRYVNVINLE